MARPTKLTEQVQKTITDAIAIGATYQAAAEYAGIPYKTFREWMLKGEQKRKPYRAFREAIEQANARAQIRLLAEINKADDWRSKTWILERRFPDGYAATVKFNRMSDDELRAFIAQQLTELGAGPDGSQAARAEDQHDAD